MITFTSADLRSLAAVLDALSDVEESTGVLLEGAGGNTLTTPGADTVRFSRKIENVDGGRAWYVVEIPEG